MISKKAINIFEETITNYHQYDDFDKKIDNPYSKNIGNIKSLLYQKCWIDLVQWHLEDVIRDPNINPVDALKIKRRIDVSNQERTDMVEAIDECFLNEFNEIVPNRDAKINTESPAWGIDRLSILSLKVYHMNEEVHRQDSSAEYKNKCQSKLNILLEQKKDLSLAIDQLLDAIKKGNKYMKTYKQMKMYNDQEMNPILRSGK